MQAFGRVDILVNNAGISSRGAALDTELAVDRKIMETNFFGTVSLTRGSSSYEAPVYGRDHLLLLAISRHFPFSDRRQIFKPFIADLQNCLSLKICNVNNKNKAMECVLPLFLPSPVACHGGAGRRSHCGSQQSAGEDWHPASFLMYVHVVLFVL